VTGALFLALGDGRKTCVRLAASPRRRVLITDRREQGVGETHTLGVELDDRRAGGLLEPVENLPSVAVSGNE
jgi:hypothetical protein